MIKISATKNQRTSLQTVGSYTKNRSMLISLIIMGHFTIIIGEVQELINRTSDSYKLQTDESVKAFDKLHRL